MNIPVFLCSTSAIFFFILDHTCAIRCPEISVRYGRVRYRSRGRVAIFGCWNGFTLYGEKYGGCFRGSWDVPPPKCVKRGCTDVGFKFGTIRKPLFNTAVLAFKCYSGYSIVGPKEIFCNGTLYDNIVPTCKREETNISCDFENQKLCKWRNDPTVNLAFHLRQQATPSRILNTGPDHDHTLDPEVDGYYLYLESSSTSPGESARIFTPYLPHATDDNTCFKFWYHMYGSTIGALKVYINDTQHFERKGNRGDRWRLGKVKLPTTNHFKIMVEAVTGQGYTGDIALDDFDVGECSDESGETCLDRCSEDERDEFATCDCHPGCMDSLTCCNDYSQHCIAETTTQVDESTTMESESVTEWDVSTSDLFTIQTDDNILEDTTLADRLTEETTTQYPENTNDICITETATNEFELSTDMLEEYSSPVQSSNQNETDVSYSSFSSKFMLTNTIPIKTSTKSPEITSTQNYSSRPTPRYNLRPRTTRITATVSIPTKSTFIDLTTNSTNVTPIYTSKTIKITNKTTTKMTTKLSTKPTIKINVTTSKPPTPIVHQPVMSVSSKATDKPNASLISTTVSHFSTKDPKITTHLISSWTEAKKSTIVSFTTNPLQFPQVTVDSKTADKRPIKTDEQETNSVYNDKNSKWKSKYKAKGAFQLVDNIVTEQAGFNNWTSVIGVLLCITVVAGSALIAILFLRKRRISSGPSDEADILFIPSDEMLDFTPSFRGQNRDSGVYSETVTSLKREK